MLSVQNFAFEEQLVRVAKRDGEHWFVGKDVCECLGIGKHHQALDELDQDERGTCAVGTPGGEQVMVVISEPGVYRLVFRSRKPEAERFKRWLAHEVLPSLRKTGRFGVEAAAAPAPCDIREEPLLHKLHILREARAIHGRAVAALLWRRLGLPDVPPPPPTALDEARLVLRTILDAAAYPGGPRVRELVARALEDDEEARVLLLPCGIRVYADSQTFVIANASPWLTEVLRGTEWAGQLVAMRVLRRLSGARPSGPVRMGPLQPRGTCFGADALDEYAM